MCVHVASLALHMSVPPRVGGHKRARAVLRRLPRRPGAEERGAGGDEQAAGKEE